MDDISNKSRILFISLLLHFLCESFLYILPKPRIVGCYMLSASRMWGILDCEFLEQGTESC